MVNKETLSFPPNLSLCNPVEGEHLYRQRSEQEFRTFIQDTYESLYKIETTRLGTRSSICVFCRFDVGILIDEIGIVHYFINEVERTQTASLWTNTSKSNDRWNSIGTLGSTFAYVFHKYLSDLLDPQINY